MAITILSLKEKAEKTFKKNCGCGCKFTYTNSDVVHDFRDGDFFIQCPNCKSMYIHKRELFKDLFSRKHSSFGDRANDC